MRWRERLAPYYRELGIDPAAPIPSSNRTAFDAKMCDVVEETKPDVVSFHFGLPEPKLLERVKAHFKVMSSATTAAEARWLEERGVDAIIAQGNEAGGHRGNFLGDDIATQAGTFALVPQVVDAVKVPVIAAGGITDARGIAAAFALGAAGVQIGTAYLWCPEAKISAPHRAALGSACDDGTVLTNLMTGRPARGFVNRLMRDVGPISDVAPEFPLAAGALAPLRAKAEGQGSGDFSPMGALAGAGVGGAVGGIVGALVGMSQALSPCTLCISAPWIRGRLWICAVMIRLSELSETDIRIVYTGLRPGEKLFEELLADDEHTRATPHPKLRIAKAREVDPGWLNSLLDWLSVDRIPSDAEVRRDLKRWVPEYQSQVRPKLTAVPAPSRAAGGSPP